jgi:peptidoglycan/xylan/chitin deacetylase (PgdA/CDA1 family)
MRRVTLTFDNGPTEGVTGEVLDVLQRENVKATFFLVGRRLEGREERKLAERALAEGHRIGNHSYSHAIPLGLLDERSSVAEIASAQRVLGDLGTERLFRPFGGGGRLGTHLLSVAACAHLAAFGFTCVLWNAVPRDWEDPDDWVERALSQCAASAWPLVVLHDLETGAMRHLQRFLDHLRRDNFEAVADYPRDCLPIIQGVPQLGVEAFVQAPAPSLSSK